MIQLIQRFSMSNRAIAWPLVLLATAWLSGPLQAAQIDLRLAVNYAGGSTGSGGTWDLFAKTDEQGLFSLQVQLRDVNISAVNELPRGTVNGSQNAGFSTFFTNQTQLGDLEIFTAQQVLNESSPEQGIFYGVGTLANGSPVFPGSVGGTSQLGPNITTLSGVQNVPWANDDPLWSTGVTVASGTFSGDAMPSFATLVGLPMGSLLTTVGNHSLPGLRTSAVAFTTSVTSNLNFGVATGDYNADGVVDAADYTAWRDTEGLIVAVLTGADGNGDGLINGPDYNVWVANFGASNSSTTAIPEPTTLVLGTSLLVVSLFSCRSRA